MRPSDGSFGEGKSFKIPDEDRLHLPIDGLAALGRQFYEFNTNIMNKLCQAL